MGSSQSKGGGLRRQLRPLVPRSWAELEQLRVRFQQETRRRGDPELQHFLTFPVFHAVAAPLCPSMGKVEFLAMFTALDRTRRGKIAAIDLFSGLALVVDAKKLHKLDFLMSLVENGGCKTLNRSELTIVLSAAARGLAMFTLMPQPRHDAMKPLVRRLMGDEQEIARQSIVEKALVDAEILFFMNDLEGSAGTSEELLAQQARIMSRMALLDLQAARVTEPDDRTKSGKLAAATALGVVTMDRNGAANPKAPASIEAIIRKLQHLVCPPPTSTQSAASSKPLQAVNKGDVAVATVNPSDTKKYVDARTIQRLVARISDGSLSISTIEAHRLVGKIPVDQFGLVRCGEVFRAVSSWLHANWQDDQVPFWKRAASIVANQVSNLIAGLNSSLVGISARAARAGAVSSPGSVETSSRTLADDTELNWSANIRIGDGYDADSIQTGVVESTSRVSSNQENKTVNETIKFRVGVHPQKTTPVDTDDLASEDLDNEDNDARLILCFTLRDDIADEEAVDLAAATERLLGHSDVLASLSDVWLAVRVSVGESTQNDNNNHQTLHKQLRVCLVLNRDWLSELEDNSTIHLSSCIQRLMILGEITRSLEDLVQSSLQAVRFLSSLTKTDSREGLLRSEFERFDLDKSGDWSLQEFNAFQQALGKDALDEDAVEKIFSTEGNDWKVITFDAFANLYKHCSAAEMQALFQNLRVGSLDRLVKGSMSINCVVRRSILQHITHVMVSPLRWGDSWMKRLLLLGQSSSDLSYDLHFSKVSDIFSLLVAPVPAFLVDATFIAHCVQKLSALIHPPHQEHARDQQCESLRCSLEREIEKNPSYPVAHDSQSAPGLLATPSREEAAIELCLRAVTLATKLMVGPELIELRGKHLRLVCELDNVAVR